jgi:hypothetical protein
MWAVLKGIGSLSERAWRKRLEQSQRWIAWLLSDLLGVHQRPAWLPEGVGRVRLIDATRWKTVGGTDDDVRLHQSYDLATGKMDQVQLTTRYQAESLSHFAMAEGDLMVTDAGYPHKRELKEKGIGKKGKKRTEQAVSWYGQKKLVQTYQEKQHAKALVSYDQRASFASEPE